MCCVYGRNKQFLAFFLIFIRIANYLWIFSKQQIYGATVPCVVTVSLIPYGAVLLLLRDLFPLRAAFNSI